MPTKKPLPNSKKNQENPPASVSSKKSKTEEKSTGIKKTIKLIQSKVPKPLKKNNLTPATSYQINDETIVWSGDTAVVPVSLFTTEDIADFQGGKHFTIDQKLGAHVVFVNHIRGIYFAVWAPNAAEVSLIGNFNGWNKRSHILYPRWDSSGIWEGFIPGLAVGEFYKYAITSYNGMSLEKGDPYAVKWEVRPNTSSITHEINFEWSDKKWMKQRKTNNGFEAPISVYEVHLGSWKRPTDDPERLLTYRELANILPAYCAEMGFTHVELMPVMEHPYDGSWGYQQTGYFAPTSRFGSPEDFMFLVNEFHLHDIGVILDWVPSHFPYDMHGLHLFDGSHLYEHADMRKGYHPDWKSYIFNSGRGEVKSFLLSNAIYWLRQYHIDGLRVDAVASMLQLDYSRKEGEWLPNEFGGNENLENVALLKDLNNIIADEFPDTQTIAEESSTWPGVTKPVKEGGLGFGMKWMMGWMNDTLTYFKRDTIYRKWHQNDITFSMVYAYSEKFMLPLSHDEVVHGKASMIAKMPGDEWHRYANLRVLYTYMWAHPGAKLLFMGNEIAQTTEWDFASGLHWELLQYEPHKGIQSLVMALNKLYKEEPALYEYSYDPKGFEWIAGDDSENSILVFMRKGMVEKDNLIIALNLSPVMQENYRIGVPKSGKYKEVFNSDSLAFWGKGLSNSGLKSKKIASHGRSNSLEITLPPLAGIVLKLG